MQRKSSSSMILAVLVMVMFSCVLLPGLSYADNRYVAQKYSFDATGALLAPLTANFGSAKKTAHVERKELSSDRRLLLIAFATGAADVFAVQMFDSRNYSIYKMRLRDDRREEIVIFGLGKNDEKKVQLQELRIIGEDAAGKLVLLPVRGFQPESVLNSPLQLDSNRAMLFPLGVGNKDIKIYWDAATEAFICSNAVSGQPVAGGEAKGADI